MLRLTVIWKRLFFYNIKYPILKPKIFRSEKNLLWSPLEHTGGVRNPLQSDPEYFRDICPDRRAQSTF